MLGILQEFMTVPGEPEAMIQATDIRSTGSVDAPALAGLPPATLTLDNPLWRFALCQWQDEAVQAACLECQNHDWSVSHLLVALWCGQQGIAWDGEEPRALGIWRETATASLRRLRQAIPKGHAVLASMRHRLQEAELASEQVELAWWYHELLPLLGAAESREDADDLVIANLNNLARRQRVAVDASLKQLARIFCPASSPDRIQRLFEQPVA